MFTRLMYELLKLKPYSKVTVVLGKHKIRAEVADTFSKKSIGLMHREKIGSGEGMLFPFPFDHAWQIWMLNMHFPIDIIWLDSKRRVVYVAERARPCKSVLNCKPYVPDAKARYVLELGSGVASKLKIKSGDKVSWN